MLAIFTDANPYALKSNFSGTITWGDGTASTFQAANVSQPLGSGTPFLVSGSHTYQQDDALGNGGAAYPVTVTINDAGGSSATSAGDTTVNVGDAPLAVSTKPLTISAIEGFSTGSQVVAKFTDPNPYSSAGNFSATINWGDGIGTAVPATVSLLSSTAQGVTFAVSGSYTYTADDLVGNSGYPYQVAVSIVDSGGLTTTAATNTTVNVADAPLTASAMPMKYTTTEWAAPIGPVTVATFTDADPNAVPSDYSGTINWGDGQSEAFTSGNVAQVSSGNWGVTFTVSDSGTHSYAEEGAYAVKVTINDVGGGSVTAKNTTVSVADAPLSDAGSLAGLTQNVGLSTGYVAVANFTDGNPNAPVSDFSGTINWGDGKTSKFTSANVTLVGPGATFDVDGSHTYATSGTYPVTVNVKDAGRQQRDGAGHDRNRQRRPVDGLCAGGPQRHRGLFHGQPGIGHLLRRSQCRGGRFLRDDRLGRRHDLELHVGQHHTPDAVFAAGNQLFGRRQPHLPAR